MKSLCRKPKTIVHAHTLKSLLTNDVHFASQQATDRTVLMEVDGKREHHHCVTLKGYF